MSVGRIITVALLVSALGLTACGRRGKLEPPPEAADAPAPTAEKQTKAEDRDSYLLDFLIN